MPYLRQHASSLTSQPATKHARMDGRTDNAHAHTHNVMEAKAKSDSQSINQLMVGGWETVWGGVGRGLERL